MSESSVSRIRACPLKKLVINQEDGESKVYQPETPASQDSISVSIENTQQAEDGKSIMKLLAHRGTNLLVRRPAHKRFECFLTNH